MSEWQLSEEDTAWRRIGKTQVFTSSGTGTERTIAVLISATPASGPRDGGLPDHFRFTGKWAENPGAVRASD